MPVSHLDEMMQAAASRAENGADLRIRCLAPEESAPEAEADVILVGTMADRLEHPRSDVDVCVSAGDRTNQEMLRELIEHRIVERCSRLAGDAHVRTCARDRRLH